MQDIKKPRTLHQVDSWLLFHASALISYSAGDNHFAESLAAHIRDRGWRQSEVLIDERASIYLWPKDRDEAIINTHWLLTELDYHPEAIYARGVLAAFAAEFESPKDLIIGIVGVAIISQTPEIIHRKKKLKSHLALVLDKNWLHSHSTRELTTLSLELSQRIISTELRLAGGHAFRLHPDTATWCFEESLTKLYSTSKAVLKKIKAEATIEELPHQTKNNTAIALSPIIDTDFLTQFETQELV